jgi:hypothetical protein
MCVGVGTVPKDERGLTSIMPDIRLQLVCLYTLFKRFESRSTSYTTSTCFLYGSQEPEYRTNHHENRRDYPSVTASFRENTSRRVQSIYQDLLGIGQYIVFPTPAADGEEVLDGAPIPPDSSTLPDPVPDPVGVVEEDEEDDDGSGGAAMNISDCAPSWNPYRAL